MWKGAGGLNVKETHKCLLLVLSPRKHPPALLIPAGYLHGIEVTVVVASGLATTYPMKPYFAFDALDWFLDVMEQTKVFPLYAVGLGASHLTSLSLIFLVHQMGIMTAPEDRHEA